MTRRIARAGGALDGITVVEIGPGPGGLTRALLASGARRVIAIERDSRAHRRAREIAAHYPGRLTVIDGDALASRPRAAVSTAPARSSPTCPTTSRRALLVRWLGTEPWPPWYDMPGADVPARGRANASSPRRATKAYGRLAVLAGWRTEAKIMFDVAAIAPSCRRPR